MNEINKIIQRQISQSLSVAYAISSIHLSVCHDDNSTMWAVRCHFTICLRSSEHLFLFCMAIVCGIDAYIIVIGSENNTTNFDYNAKYKRGKKCDFMPMGEKCLMCVWLDFRCAKYFSIKLETSFLHPFLHIPRHTHVSFIRMLVVLTFFIDHSHSYQVYVCCVCVCVCIRYLPIECIAYRA